MLDIIQKFRYRILLFLVVGIISLGFFLNIVLEVSPDKVVPILVSSFAIVALFLNALSFEYTWFKNLKDSQGSKESLTFNTAIDWHKSPLKDYIIKIVVSEPAMKEFFDPPDGEKLHSYISAAENIDVRAAIAGLFNYLETISIGIEQKLLDEKFMKLFYEGVVISFYTEYKFYITYRREQIDKSKKLWINFTNVATRWEMEKDTTKEAELG